MKGSHHPVWAFKTTERTDCVCERLRFLYLSAILNLLLFVFCS